MHEHETAYMVMESNTEPSCCEATALTAQPQCLQYFCNLWCTLKVHCIIFEYTIIRLITKNRRMCFTEEVIKMLGAFSTLNNICSKINTFILLTVQPAVALTCMNSNDFECYKYV